MLKNSRRYVAILVALLLFTYVGYQVYIGSRKGMTTEVAVMASVSDYFETEAFILRREDVVTASYAGVINYVVSDGTRVSKGGDIADIYYSEQYAAAKSRLATIEKELEDLNALLNPGGYYASNPEIAGTQIRISIEDMLVKKRRNEFSDMAQSRNNLQDSLNRRKIITGEDSPDDYAERINELESEKASLEGMSGGKTGSITAPKAGFFVSVLDGYENMLFPSNVENLTVEEITQMLATKPQNKIDNSAIGKISTGFDWYIACVISEDDAIKIEQIDNVTIEIPFSVKGKIPATIVSRNRDHQTGKIAIVFKCYEMDADIAVLRKEVVKVNIRTYEGVLVNQKAIHFEDVETKVKNADGEYETQIHKNVRGVFIRFGEKIEFVQVFYEKIINGYAICKLTLNDIEQESIVTDYTIKLYDNVIVEGKDLYDGKYFY